MLVNTIFLALSIVKVWRRSQVDPSVDTLGLDLKTGELGLEINRDGNVEGGTNNAGKQPAHWNVQEH